MRLATFFINSVCAVTLGGTAFAQETAATPDVLFIVDGSGSMWGRVNEVEKIVIAKDVMTGLIDGLPPEIDAGLIAYGHRERGSCSDIELIATPGTTPRTDLLSALAGITPLGKTPISGSLLRAGELVRETEDAVTIVLVSDGIESCEGDPCATAALLREQDIDVKIHVVGFDVDAEAQEQLSCIASAGGGEYYEAGSADALNDALADVRTSIVEATVVEEPEPIVTTLTLNVAIANVSLAEDVIGGVNVIDTASDETLLRLTGTKADQIPPGSYQFGFDHFLSPALEIETGEDYVITAAQFGLSTVQLDGAQVGGVNMVNIETGETLLRLAGTSPEQMAPGTYLFEFDSFTSPPFRVEASQTYTISADDFALANIVMDGTQVGGVNVIEDATGERLVRLAGTSPKQIPAGTYRFGFDYFTSPPFVVEGNGGYTISPSDYNLSLIKMDGTQVGGVNMIDDATGERLLRLSGTAAEHVPPGTYRFGFDYFDTPPFVVADNGDYTISPSDYGLATVSKTRDLEGRLDMVRDGEVIVGLTGDSPEQIPPGEYTLVHSGSELGTITIEANAVQVFEFQ